MKFDVIVGNPPFQGSAGDGSKMPNSHNLWSKIAIMAIDLLNDGGVISFITPSSWMSPTSKLLPIMREKQLLSVNCKIDHYFIGVGSLFTHWTLQNTPPYTHTVFDDQNIDISKFPYLLMDYKSLLIHEKILFVNNNKIKINFDASMHSQNVKKKPGLLSKTKSVKYPFKIFHTNAQILWSSKISKNFKDKKVVFTTSGYLKPFYDQGEIGTSEICGFINVSSDVVGVNTVKYLNSKLIQFLITTGKWGGFSNGKVLSKIPKIDLTRSWTDKELYDHFNLDPEERKYIEENVK